MLLPTAYFPPISYIRPIISSIVWKVEAYEHFVKQTIRNHCEIYGANGRLKLTVPIEHSNRWRIPIKDIRLSNESSWRRLHLKSIQSAYGKSAFFEYYWDDLEAILTGKHEYLIDLNNDCLSLLLQWLKQPSSITTTKEYDEKTPDEQDLRSEWNGPRHVNPTQHQYHQVFSERHGFLNDLSTIDLIFNTGPEALHVLRQS